MKALYKPGLEFYVDKIRTGKPFTFVRYGDDEWKVVTGHRDRSILCGKVHRMDLPGLQTSMQETLTGSPMGDNHYPATRNAYHGNPGVVEYHAWLQWMQAHHVDLDWHYCNVFADASRTGELYPFIEVVQDLDATKVVVGPSWLKNMSRIFPVDVFIEIRETNAWLDAHHIMDRCIEVNQPAFYSISAGVAAGPICEWLYWWFGQQSWILDLGSLWDPFMGVKSRSYHKDITPDIIKSNLGGKQWRQTGRTKNT